MSSSVFADDELKYYQFDEGLLEVQAPVNWDQIQDTPFLSLQSPNGDVAITASAFRNNGEGLNTFSNLRFEAVHDMPFYKPQTEVYGIKSGVVREYEGIWPGETSPTYYAVAAVDAGDAFVSITVVTTAHDFATNKPLYIEIFETVNVNL